MQSEDPEIVRLRAKLKEEQQKLANDPERMRALRASQRRTAAAVKMFQHATRDVR